MGVRINNEIIKKTLRKPKIAKRCSPCEYPERGDREGQDRPHHLEINKAVDSLKYTGMDPNPLQENHIATQLQSIQCLAIIGPLCLQGTCFLRETGTDPSPTPLCKVN